MDMIADQLIREETITGKDFMRLYRKAKGMMTDEDREIEAKLAREGKNIGGDKKELNVLSFEAKKPASGAARTESEATGTAGGTTEKGSGTAGGTTANESGASAETERVTLSAAAADATSTAEASAEANTATDAYATATDATVATDAYATAADANVATDAYAAAATAAPAATEADDDDDSDDEPSGRGNNGPRGRFSEVPLEDVDRFLKNSQSES